MSDTEHSRHDYDSDQGEEGEDNLFLVDPGSPVRDEDEEFEEQQETQQELEQREAEDDDDDPVAEGEVEVEPSYAKANAIPFFELATRLDTLYQSVRQKRRLKDSERLQYLLPPKLLEYLCSHDPDQPPESIFPLYRLLIPEKDTSRFISIKESAITDMYAKAFDLVPKDVRKLKNFQSPSMVETDVCGDFSSVLERVLPRRIDSAGSDYTVQDINELLDDLYNLKIVRATNHDWQLGSLEKKIKRPTLKELRIAWLRGLRCPTNGRRPLSAREHKWLVRIIQRKLEFGLGFTKILHWYDPRAMEKWSSRGTLKRICRDLAFVPLESSQGPMCVESAGPLPYLAVSPEGLEFGTEFDPMRSEKTGFQIVLTNLSERHREYFKTQAVTPLAALHPVFTVETKLDGERMFVHFRRDGVVRIHSRQQVWYSALYSPVLGPALRRAVGRHQMDLILDGEILAWDSVRNETVPFGNNRTIATLRRRWMERNNLCDDRDLALHKEEEDKKRIFVAANSSANSKDPDFDLAGVQCWLQFVAFDILYLAGEGAQELIRSTVCDSSASEGSLINLNCMERKKLLHKIIDEQRHEVEIVQTNVIRPNGDVEVGSDYFSVDHPLRECGYPAYVVDSIACAVDGVVRDLTRVDAERRRRRSDEEISQIRAMAIHEIYKHTVEDQRQEGLILKDLSTYYVLGEQHRSKRYWLKFKPDYFNGSVASDLDVVIVGAYFASGLRSAGRPSSFLCACVDSKDPNAYYPVTRVNARSMKDDDYRTFLKMTGYVLAGERSDEQGVHLGSWRKPDPGDPLPTFVTHRSHQAVKDKTGRWNFAKVDLPDLWIDPKDSCVVTLNAGEIVSSDVFPSGVTLRFPRITKLRLDGDAKDPHDIESDDSLWQKYQNVLEHRSSLSAMNLGDSTARIDGSVECRFLTESQFFGQKRQSKRKAAPQLGSLVDVTVPIVSKLLTGRSFTVLEGRYCLANEVIDVAVARQHGWYVEASKVKNRDTVQRFIKKHSGIVRLSPSDRSLMIGGRADDPRAVSYGRVRDGGVVRWTYVFSLVSRLQAGMTQNLAPTVLDYLIQPRQELQLNVAYRISRNCNISDPLKMLRALDLIKQQRNAKPYSADRSEIQAWQTATRNLPKRIQRVLAPRRAALWPSNLDDDPIVLYPDVFGNEFGAFGETEHNDEAESERWDRVQSDPAANRIRRSLPLVQAMGSILTTSLHSKVTHVLCHFSDHSGIVDWDDFTEDELRIMGLRDLLLDRLRLVRRFRTKREHLVLLTPEYIRSKFS